jgi:DNA polymerase III subunit chi
MRVDFYLLESTQADARWVIACRLVEKAYQRGHKVYIQCTNQHDAELLDERLWTFKEDSFIPHNLQGEGPEPPPPVQIGWGKEPRGFDDILINLSGEILPFSNKFQRVMEIILNNETDKEHSRIRYKQYRAQHCQLHVHELAYTLA